MPVVCTMTICVCVWAGKDNILGSISAVCIKSSMGLCVYTVCLCPFGDYSTISYKSSLDSLSLSLTYTHKSGRLFIVILLLKLTGSFLHGKNSQFLLIAFSIQNLSFRLSPQRDRLGMERTIKSPDVSFQHDNFSTTLF